MPLRVRSNTGLGVLVDEHEDRRMTTIYPCDRCNMDEGSPVCLQDGRCPSRRITAPEHTVASIPDAELLRRVVRSVARNRPRRKAFAWAAVSEAFGLGSTYSMQLCRRFGLDPDTGAEAETPNS